MADKKKVEEKVEKMKTSRIRKTINRKIQTASFEQLDVNVEIEEEIEWTTPKERMEKTDKITKVLVIDFMRTFNKTLEQLKIDRKLGKITATSLPVSTEEDNNNKKEHDFDFLSEG